DIIAAERSILAQYGRAIDAARSTSCIENQALPIPAIVRTLERALRRGLEVVLVIPVEPEAHVPRPNSRLRDLLGCHLPGDTIALPRARWLARREGDVDPHAGPDDVSRTAMPGRVMKPENALCLGVRTADEQPPRKTKGSDNMRGTVLQE